MGFVSFIIEEMPETVNDMTINFIGRLTADDFFKKSDRDTLTGEVYGDILYLVGGDEMLNSSDILRGYTDTIILAQLAEGDSYGYVISKNVQEITRGELQLKEATLYTTFRRLEAAGMIESYWGNENAGARRRYYHLTEKGRALFAENQADWRKYRAVISELFGMEDASK